MAKRGYESQKTGQKVDDLLDKIDNLNVPEWALQESKPSYTAQEVHALPENTSIPKKTSDLVNDKGFISQESDPTVPSWAKQPSKPEYTAQEVGALPEDTPLFSGDYNDLRNKPTIPTVPENVSAFNNDAGYLTVHQDISGKEDKSNKVTSLSAQNTDIQYPSAKVVFDNLSTKQDAINDLGTIRSGASAGATAYQKPQAGIPESDLSQGVKDKMNDVFWATYGTTTAAEIDAAVAAGKLVYTIYSNQYCPLVHITNDYYSFVQVNRNIATVRLDINRSTSVWSVGSFPLELASRKVNSWQATPDNNHYPSEKLVKESLDAKAGVEDVTAEVSRASAKENSLDNRLSIVEELAEISVEGGTIGIASSEDFTNRTPAGDAKIPTVGAVLGGADEVPTPGSENLVKSGGVDEAFGNIHLEIKNKIIRPTLYLQFGKVNKTTGVVERGNNACWLLTPIFVKRGYIFKTNITPSATCGFLSISQSNNVEIGDTLTYISQETTYIATEDCYIIINIYSSQPDLNANYIEIIDPNNLTKKIEDVESLSLLSFPYEDGEKIIGFQRKGWLTSYRLNKITTVTSQGSSIICFPVAEGKSYHIFGLYSWLNNSNGGILFTSEDVLDTDTGLVNCPVVVPQTTENIVVDLIYEAPGNGYIVVGSVNYYYEIAKIDISVFETDRRHEQKIEKNETSGNLLFYGNPIIIPKKVHSYNLKTAAYAKFTGTPQAIDTINDKIYQFTSDGTVVVVTINSFDISIHNLNCEEGISMPHFGNVRFGLNSQEDGNKILYVSSEGTSHTVEEFLVDSSWNLTRKKYFNVPANDTIREFTGNPSLVSLVGAYHCAFDPENGMGCMFIYPAGHTTGASHDYCDIMVQPFTVKLNNDGDVSSTVVAKEEEAFIIPSCGGRLQDFYYLDGILFIISGSYQDIEYPTHISVLDIRQKKVVSQIVIPYNFSNCEAQGISIYENSIIASVWNGGIGTTYYQITIP